MVQSMALDSFWNVQCGQILPPTPASAKSSGGISSTPDEDVVGGAACEDRDATARVSIPANGSWTSALLTSTFLHDCHQGLPSIRMENGVKDIRIFEFWGSDCFGKHVDVILEWRVS